MSTSQKLHKKYHLPQSNTKALPIRRLRSQESEKRFTESNIPKPRDDQGNKSNPERPSDLLQKAMHVRIGPHEAQLLSKREACDHVHGEVHANESKVDNRGSVCARRDLAAKVLHESNYEVVHTAGRTWD